MIIDGRKLAFEKEALLKKEISQLKKIKKRSPRLISVAAKEDTRGLLYTNLKQKVARRLGIDFKKFTFSLKQKDRIYSLLEKIISQGKFDGLIIQKPGQRLIAKYFGVRGGGKKDFDLWWLTATHKIPEQKDVDCLNAVNLGLISAGLIQFYPTTVKAILSILAKVFKKEELRGKTVIILGSSDILGKPLAMLLRDKGMTVILCGSSCRDLKSLMQKAQIIISGVGKPNLIKAGMIKKGAVVIDAGITKLGERIVGDVDFPGVAKIASVTTPVPGGVGPLTVISLMENVVKSFRGIKRMSQKICPAHSGIKMASSLRL